MKRVTVSFPWPLTASETREILSFGFQVALVTYLGLYLIESLQPGYVSTYYNLDTFLWIAIVTGVLSGVWPMFTKDARKEHAPPSWKDFLWIGLLSIGTVAVVWYKISSFGWLVKVIAPLSGLVVLGLSLLVYFNRDDDPDVSG